MEQLNAMKIDEEKPITIRGVTYVGEVFRKQWSLGGKC